MSARSPIPVEEYLNTAYSPDCDYVDGQLVERNVGERPHSLVQRKLIGWFLKNCPGFEVWPGQRLQVSPTHVRIPDIAVTLEDPRTDVFETPPLIAIEILSRDDRMTEMQDKIDDYLAFGIRNIWMIDPQRRSAYVCEPTAIRRVSGDALEVAESPIRLPLAELFE